MLLTAAAGSFMRRGLAQVPVARGTPFRLPVGQFGAKGDGVTKDTVGDPAGHRPLLGIRRG